MQNSAVFSNSALYNATKCHTQVSTTHASVVRKTMLVSKNQPCRFIMAWWLFANGLYKCDQDASSELHLRGSTTSAVQIHGSTRCVRLSATPTLLSGRTACKSTQVVMSVQSDFVLCLLQGGGDALDICVCHDMCGDALRDDHISVRACCLLLPCFLLLAAL